MQASLLAPEKTEERPLPRRDWLLLPLISLATIVLTVGASEVLARTWKPEYTHGICSVADPTAGPRAKPNCVMVMKNAEGPEVEYRFNECGYRSLAPCGPRPAGALRLVVMGTSVALGMNVPYEKLFGVIAARELSKRCGRPVDFQNLGTLELEASNQLPLVDEALKLKPDAILFTLMPYDVENGFTRPLDPADRPVARGPTYAAKMPLATQLSVELRKSRALFCIQHSLLLDRDFVLRGYRYAGNPNDVLHQPFSPMATERFANLDVFAKYVAQKINAAHAAFFFLPLPNRVGAALLGSDTQIPGVDPRAFGRKVAAIAMAHGLDIADTTPEFAGVRHPEQAYYAVDGHPNVFGHEILARAVVERLMSAPTAFAAAASERSR